MTARPPATEAHAGRWVLVAAALLGVGSPAWPVPAATVGGLIAMRACMGDSVGNNMARGGLITAGAAAISLRWVPAAWSAYTGEPGWLPAVVVVLLSALPGAMALGVATLLEQRRVHPMVAMGLALAVGEGVCRVLPIGLGFTAGFARSWALLGPAALFGRPFLALFLGMALGARRSPRLLAALVLVWFTTARLFVHFHGPSDVVRIVHTGIDGLQARRPSMAHDRAALLLDASNTEADWVLTPEAAWPYALGRTDSGRAGFVQAWQGRPPVLLGGHTGDEDALNAVALVEQGTITALVGKRFLVPFSEATASSGGRRVTRGAPLRRIQVGDTVIGVLICWEDVLPIAISTLPSDTSVLALPSSDVWLGSIGQAHHADAARFAAVTSGRWAVRATPTGRSGLISPSGQFMEDVTHIGGTTVSVPVRRLPWLAAWWGHLVVGVSALTALVLLRRPS